MKIKVNGVWCDTKFDWGYKSDSDFIAYIFSEKIRLEKLVKIQHEEIKRLKKLLDKRKKKSA